MRYIQTMKTYIQKLYITVMLLVFVIGLNAQVTTATIRGRVTDANKEPVAGANVLAVHESSGTKYGAITNAEGRYTIQGMRSGGPYRVVVSFISMNSNETKGIILQLGEVFRHDVELMESTELLDEIVIIGKAGIDATKTGAAMNVTSAEINRMPSITHGIADVIRMNPQVRVANDGAMYFLGMNNRYNSFQID